MFMKKYSEGLTSIAFIAFSFIFFASLIVFINLSTPVSFKGKWKEVEIPKGASYSKGIAFGNKRIVLFEGDASDWPTRAKH